MSNEKANPDSAFDEIGLAWGYDVAYKIAEIKSGIGDAFEMSQKDFIARCTGCGGNWVAMLCSGIKAISKELYDALPEKLGRNGNWAFINLLSLLEYLGVQP